MIFFFIILVIFIIVTNIIIVINFFIMVIIIMFLFSFPLDSFDQCHHGRTSSPDPWDGAYR